MPDVPGLAVVQPRRPVGAGDDEERRLAVLRSYGILDTAAESVFDELALLAAEVCGTPMATITLVDEGRQWFKSRIGVDDRGHDRGRSLCAHALHRSDPLIVPDTHRDPRLRDNPLVLGGPRIRSYVGAPLITPEGLTLGTLCVMDTEVRTLTDGQVAQLVLLSRQVMAHLAARRLTQRLTAEIATLRDAEQELRATDRLMRGVLSHPGAVVHAKDLDGRYILGNDSLHALFGAAPGTLMGRTDHDLLDAGTADDLREVDREIVRHGAQRILSETLPQPDGSRRHYLSTKFPLRRADGAIYAVAAVSTDVTAQVTAARILEDSERRWRQLFDESPVGIGLVDGAGVIVAANAALCALSGRSHDGLVGTVAADLSHPDDRVSDDGVDLWRHSGSGVVQREWRYVRPDGEVRWALLTVTRTPGPQGQPWTLAHVQDVTERLQNELRVRDSEADLSAVAEVVRQIQAGGDVRRTIVAACVELAGARFVALFEPDPDATGTLRVTGATEPALVDLNLGRAVPSAIWTVWDTPDASAADVGDQVFPVSVGGGGTVLAVPVRAGAAVSGVLALGFDGPVPPLDDRRHRVVRLLAYQAAVAIRQSALLADLAERAVTDPLTGLPNRRGWDAAVSRMTPAGLPDRRLVVGLVDFDAFKQFNDTRGHAVGDELLRGFAVRARSVLRAEDVIARWGGEEFALALPHCDDVGAAAVLERVRASMPDDQTCSIGYTELGPDQDVARAMIDADAALYVAKTSGRNRIQRF